MFPELKASASDYQSLTTLSDSMTLSILGTGGNNISAYYLASDNTYKSCTLTPINTNLTFGSSNVDGYAINYWTARDCIVYRCPVPSDIKYGIYSAKQYMIPFNRHFGNVDFFEFGIASVDNVGSLYDYYLQTSVSTWSEYNYIQAGDDVSDVYPLRSRSNSSYGAIVHCEQWDYPFCCFTYEANEKGDFWLGDCYCYPCYSGSEYDYFVISNIRINDDYIFYGEGYFPPPVTSATTSPVIDSASGEASGVIGEGTNTTPINVTINIENDNTSLVGRILSGIASIFIPDDEFMNEFTEDLQEEFADHLGGVSEAIELLDEQADYFRNAVAVNTVYFPGLEMEFDGQDYTIIQSQDVELRPANTSSGLKELWDAVAFAVDVVAVLAVLNMLQTKYEIFLNPDGEVIDYDS